MAKVMLRSKKYSLVKETFNSLKMVPNELSNDICSFLNAILNKISAIGLSKLSVAPHPALVRGEIALYLHFHLCFM
jgi:hypothetical protein